jgi:hypothetical protein
MEWLISIISGLVSSSAVIAAIFFIGRESFKNALSKNLESFKHDLSTDLESFKHDLGLESTRHQFALQSQIQFRERQLSEFYGPIYALLKRIRPIDNLWNEGKLRDVDDAIREVICESNNRIVEIILNKSYLIRGDSIPESHTHFLAHVAVWHAFLNSSHKGWPKSPKLPEAYYKMEFEEEVFRTAEALKRELHELYKRYGLAETKPAGENPESRVEPA